MKSYVTPAGKTIELKVKENTSLIKVYFGQGGEIPEALSGLFTSEKEAEKAILFYLDQVKDKQPKSKKQ